MNGNNSRVAAAQSFRRRLQRRLPVAPEELAKRKMPWLERLRGFRDISRTLHFIRRGLLQISADYYCRGSRRPLGPRDDQLFVCVLLSVIMVLYLERQFQTSAYTTQ